MDGDSDAIRAGETSISLPDPKDATLRFIGRIRTPFASRAECPRQGREDGPECRLELDPAWGAALDGVEAFERLDVLYWLDRARRDLVTQSPRSDGSTRGTFALRSPVRPNPIGLARVRLVRREGCALVVRGLDCIDGTPLLDIKPEACAFTPQAPAKAADRR
ncbi:tRNA (N6-threonylcarbamoyladenosine(37)-N6)-methyltransferase TrmO [Roseivivax sp. CAU 1761]